jgi:hypothetical protein
MTLNLNCPRFRRTWARPWRCAEHSTPDVTSKLTTQWIWDKENNITNMNVAPSRQIHYNVWHIDTDERATLIMDYGYVDVKIYRTIETRC